MSSLLEDITEQVSILDDNGENCLADQGFLGVFWLVIGKDPY
jgi:hypothetical protein